MKFISLGNWSKKICQHYKGLGLIAFSLCYLMFIMAYIVIPNVPEGDEDIKFYFASICVACFFMIFIGYVTLHLEIKIEYKYAVIGTLVSLVMMLLLPPFSGPDEFSHYQSSYNVANHILQVDKPDEYPSRIYMRSMDADFGFPRGKKVSLYTNLFVPSDNVDTYGYKEADVQLMHTSSINYVIPSVGIAIARIFDITTIPMIYLGRIFNTLLMLLSVFISLRLLPAWKEVLFFIALSPVVVQAGVTYSTDCFAYAISLMFISTILSYRNGRKMTIKGAAIIFLLGLVVACLRSGAYLTVSGAVFLLNAKSFTSVSYYRKYLFAAVVCYLAAGLYTLHSAMAVPYFITDMEVYSVSYVLSNLDVAVGLFFHLFTETLCITIFSIFTGGVELTRVTGSLGSFPADVVSIVMFLGLCCIKNPTILLRKEYMIIVIMIAGEFIEFSAAALTWTTKGNPFIDCIWGRYLIIPLFLFGMLFKSSLPIDFSNSNFLLRARCMFIFVALLIYLATIYSVAYVMFLA